MKYQADDSQKMEGDDPKQLPKNGTRNDWQFLVIAKDPVQFQKMVITGIPILDSYWDLQYFPSSGSDFPFIERRSIGFRSAIIPKKWKRSDPGDLPFFGSRVFGLAIR